MLPNHMYRQTWLDKIFDKRSIKWNVQPTKMILCSNWWVIYLSCLLLPTIFAWEMNFLSKCLKIVHHSCQKKRIHFFKNAWIRQVPKNQHWTCQSSFTAFNHSYSDHQSQQISLHNIRREISNFQQAQCCSRCCFKLLTQLVMNCAFFCSPNSPKRTWFL